MEKFDPDKVYYCPKCKGDVSDVKYIFESCDNWHGFLKLTCGQCNHFWYMLPCDAEGEK